MLPGLLPARLPAAHLAWEASLTTLGGHRWAGWSEESLDCHTALAPTPVTAPLPGLRPDLLRQVLVPVLHHPEVRHREGGARVRALLRAAQQVSPRCPPRPFLPRASLRRPGPCNGTLGQGQGQGLRSWWVGPQWGGCVLGVVGGEACAVPVSVRGTDPSVLWCCAEKFPFRGRLQPSQTRMSLTPRRLALGPLAQRPSEAEGSVFLPSVAWGTTAVTPWSGWRKVPGGTLENCGVRGPVLVLQGPVSLGKRKARPPPQRSCLRST